MQKFLILIFFVFADILSYAQTTAIPDISADRPGMATPPALLIPGTLQLETCMSFEHNIMDEGFINILSYNSPLIRAGISKYFELRLKTDYLLVDNGKTLNDGLSALNLGTKIRIKDDAGIFPQTSFLLNFKFPKTGKFGPTYIAPSGYLLLKESVGKKFFICYNIGLEFNGETNDPSVFNTIFFGYNFSDKLGGFFETYGWYNINDYPNSIDAGLSYLLNKNIQIDLYSGAIYLPHFKKYYFVSAGFSWRLGSFKSGKENRTSLMNNTVRHFPMI